MRVTQVMNSVPISALVHVPHVCTSFRYLRSGWTRCAEIWCVVMGQLAMHFMHATDGVHLHVLTFVHFFHSSEFTGRIMLKYGVLLDPLAMQLLQARSRAYIHLHNWTSFLSTYVRFRSFVAQKASYWCKYPQLIVTTLRRNVIRRKYFLSRTCLPPSFFVVNTHTGPAGLRTVRVNSRQGTDMFWCH